MNTSAGWRCDICGKVEPLTKCVGKNPAIRELTKEELEGYNIPNRQYHAHPGCICKLLDLPEASPLYKVMQEKQNILVNLEKIIGRIPE